MTRFDGESWIYEGCDTWICQVQESIVCDSGGSSSNPISAPAQQTITQTQQIPQFEQDFSQQNQNIAASIASTPVPVYKGQMIAPFTDQQNQAIAGTPGAANSYQPGLNAAQGMTAAGTQQWTPQTAQQYMSPYTMAALQPQLQALQLQQGQNQLGIDRSSSQAGAFGDARNGVAQSLNNFYGGLQQQDIIAQAMNNAYTTGQAAFQGDQARMLQGGQQMGTLAGQQQNLGLNAQNAIFSAGGLQQNQQQEALNNAYQQFLNQQNWPQQMLNTRLSALSNSPYTLTDFTTLPRTSSTAQNLGAFGALAGGLGSLIGSSAKA